VLNAAPATAIIKACTESGGLYSLLTKPTTRLATHTATMMHAMMKDARELTSSPYDSVTHDPVDEITQAEANEKPHHTFAQLVHAPCISSGGELD
jgi:hypothetical protein